MLGKLIKLFLLFSLCLFIIFAALLQTDFVQKKGIAWIEKKSGGSLKIGKLEGIIPFWLRLSNVVYQEGENQVIIDKAKILISPTTLLIGKLSILNLEIDHASIHWNKTLSPPSHFSPSFYSVIVHQFRFRHLDFNSYKDLEISGAAVLDNNFSVRFSLDSPEFPGAKLEVDLQSDLENCKIAIIANLSQPRELQLWASGNYDLQNQRFEGSILGFGPSFSGSAGIAILNFSHLKLDQIKGHYKSYSLDGSLDFNFTTKELVASGHLLERPLDLETRISFEDGAIAFSPIKIRYSGDVMTGALTYQISQKSLDGYLDLSLNDLSVFPTRHPIGGRAKGHISFEQEQIAFTFEGEKIEWKNFYLPQVSFSGGWLHNQLEFSLNLQEFIVLDPAYEVFPRIQLNLKGNADLQHLSIAGQIWGLGESPFSLSAYLPVHVSLFPFDLAVQENDPFSLKVNGKGSIDPVLSFLENASLIAKGNLIIDLEVSGTWKQPSLQGYLVYDKGEVESLTTGALFRDIHMEMEASGKELQIRALIAHDVEKGDLTGNGAIVWNPEDGFPFQFHLYASRYLILALDPFTASVDADITLSGTIHEMAIQGSANVVNAHLALPNKMPLQVPTVEVTYINPLPTPKTEEENSIKNPIPIHWDIVIHADRNLKIEGRGLTSEWSGGLHIFGEQNALNYSGKLDLVQGRFSIINRTFDLVEGKVFIEGIEPKNIQVDLKGDYELASLTASIVVSGSLDHPHLNFCSQPPMSTNQIISWIVFNQDINELTPLQACKLATLLVSLSGNYSGPKTFSAIKEGLGIDVFSITDCDLDSNDFTFQVGKYISQGTFVGINKSISGDFDSILIQTRLYRNFFLEADYGGSLNGLTPNGGKVVFKWYKSY